MQTRKSDTELLLPLFMGNKDSDLKSHHALVVIRATYFTRYLRNK